MTARQPPETPAPAASHPPSLPQPGRVTGPDWGGPVVSRWRDPAILERAGWWRSQRNKGIRRALAEAKRTEAEARNKVTPPERRRRWRRAAEGAAA